MNIIQQANASGVTPLMNATAVVAIVENFQHDPLSTIAALFSIGWFALEIWESDTAKAWRQRRRDRKAKRCSSG